MNNTRQDHAFEQFLIDNLHNQPKLTKLTKLIQLLHDILINTKKK